MFDFAMILVVLQVLPTELIALLAPVVVFGVTYLVKWAIPKLPGWTVVSIVVPLLSVIVAWVAQLLVPGLSFLLQVVLGLLAVFINELIRQLQQGNS